MRCQLRFYCPPRGCILGGLSLRRSRSAVAASSLAVTRGGSSAATMELLLSVNNRNNGCSRNATTATNTSAIPLSENPLAKWSDGVRWPSSSSSSSIISSPPPLDVWVGLEGCGSALNATNAIRTSLYFSTWRPPCFLSASSAADIHSLQQRTSSATPEDVECEGGGGSCATFGRGAFDSDHSLPTVIMENFIPGARSIFHVRLSPPPNVSTTRLVIGHENDGVSPHYFRSAPPDASSSNISSSIVVYIPQFGTISSVNVVTCLGIALFYAAMDASRPAARAVTSSLRDNLPQAGDDTMPTLVSRYQRVFAELLPKKSSSSSTTPTTTITSSCDLSTLVSPPNRDRVDPRPVHPLFYNQSVEAIVATHQAYIRDLWDAQDERRVERLRLEQPGRHHSRRIPCMSLATGRVLFGLSVYYENGRDQRNFGGLLRNANAFAVDHVFYGGKKKINIQGAVGSQHYMKSIYCRPAQQVFDRNDEGVVDDDGIDAALRTALPNPLLQDGSVEWWFLSCDHDFLFTTTTTTKTTTTNTAGVDTDSSDMIDYFAQDPESMAHYRKLREDPKCHACLSSDSEAELRCRFSPYNGKGRQGEEEEEEGGVKQQRHVVLVVPEEGRLPKPSVMRRCCGIVHVKRGPDDTTTTTTTTTTRHHADDIHNEEEEEECRGGRHRGLPSQVASGIALLRLLSCNYPDMMW